jgi:hypothetical protein
MVAERAAEARVVIEQRAVEEPDVREERIQADRGVALAEDEAVTVGPVRLLGSIPQLRVVQRREELGGRERRRVVTGTGDPREPHGLEPDELRPIPESLDQFFPLGRSPWRVAHCAAHSALSDGV